MKARDVHKMMEDAFAGRLAPAQPDPLQAVADAFLQNETVENARALIEASVRHYGMVTDIVRIELVEAFAGRHDERDEVFDLIKAAGYSSSILL